MSNSNFQPRLFAVRKSCDAHEHVRVWSERGVAELVTLGPAVRFKPLTRQQRKGARNRAVSLRHGTRSPIGFVFLRHPLCKIGFHWPKVGVCGEIRPFVGIGFFIIELLVAVGVTDVTILRRLHRVIIEAER